MRYLLDSNICIEAINDPGSAVVLRMRKESPDDIKLSVIVWFELSFGACKSARKSDNLARLETFAAPFELVDFSPDDALTAGEVRAGLERKGQPIGPYDLLIAAQALNRGLTLVTNNEREFKRVPGLKIENWIKRKR